MPILRGLADLPHGLDLTGVDILRREQRQSFVGSAMVGREEGMAPFPGMVCIAESAWIAWPVLGGLELALAEGVVVADPRSGEALLDIQAGHEIGKAVGDHR